MRGKLRLTESLAAKLKPDARVRAFTVSPEVTISNSLSNRFTVIEVSGLDRPGQLYELTSALAKLTLNMGSAHVLTFGEKAVDTYYVTDLTGSKIASPRRNGKQQSSGISLRFSTRREEKKPSSAGGR